MTRARREMDDPVKQATKLLLALLARRARSRHELEVALERKAFSPETIRAAFSRIERFGYVDDGRFANDRAESLLRHGKLGAEAVKRRLLAAGVSDTVAESAVAKAVSSLGISFAAEARALLEKRRLAPPLKDAKRWAKAFRTLAARGFSEDVIGSILGSAPVDESDEHS